MKNIIIGVAIIIGIGLVIVAFICGLIALTTLGSPNKGQHSGYITAVEYDRGLIFRGDKYTVYFKTNVESSQEDQYCVTDKSLIETLKTKQESGERVTLNYERGWYVSPWECATSTSIVTSIK